MPHPSCWRGPLRNTVSCEAEVDLHDSWYFIAIESRNPDIATDLTYRFLFFADDLHIQLADQFRVQ